MHTALLGEGVENKIFKSLPIKLIGTLLASQLYGVHQYLVSSELPAAKQKEVIDETFVLLWQMITNIQS